MKRIKMLLYGEPGVGKSVFASKAPNPYFITTDGNYEFLEEFGVKPEAYTQVSGWSEAKSVFSSDVFNGYETIVVDLLEDMFKWCEYEYCVKNRIDHLSDVGFGKGYETTRNEFFIEICKLLAIEKNIILIMHETTSVVKDRRGVEHTKYAPSSRIPDKVIDMIEGRVRYCLRCYLKDEEQADGVLLKKRFLSLVPKPEEFGIIRGVNENTIPHDIPLEFKTFVDCLGLNKKTSMSNVKEIKEQKPNKKEKADVQKDIKEHFEQVADNAVEKLKILEESKVPEEVKPVDEIKTKTKEDDTPPFEVSSTSSIEIKKPEPPTQPETKIDNNDKLAAIRAKLAAINSNKNK